MALSKEFLRPAEARPGFFPSNSSFSERKADILPIKETGIRARIHELSLMLFAESKKERKTEAQSQTEAPRTDGFEPFVNPQASDNPLFINGYTGNFAQRMELNRRGIERVLKIAHLDGQVILLSLNASRQRSVDANPDGSVTGKRSLFFGEKMEEDDKENPFRRVVPTPQGWRIEISDTRIREELEKKNLTGKKLQTEFIRQFNGQLKQGLLESIRREKLSSEKDKSFILKATFAIMAHGAGTPSSYLLIRNLLNGGSPSSFLEYAPLINLMGIIFINAIGKITKDTHTIYIGRINTDNMLEYFMPYVEIDKVARTAVFLAGKGRTLVREAKPENK